MIKFFPAGIFCWLLFPLAAHAQSGDICRSVLGAAGESAQYQGWTIEYTVGEPVILTIESPAGDRALTQGFHQPEECISVSTFGPDGATPSLATLYPNPTSGMLFLSFDPAYDLEMDAQVIDLQGRICSPSMPVRASMLNELDCRDLPAGFYLLTLRAAGRDNAVSIPFSRVH